MNVQPRSSRSFGSGQVGDVQELDEVAADDEVPRPIRAAVQPVVAQEVGELLVEVVQPLGGVIEPPAQVQIADDEVVARLVHEISDQ